MEKARLVRKFHQEGGRSEQEEAGKPFALQMEKRPPRRRSQTPLESGKEKMGSLLYCQATPARGLQISHSQGNQKCTFVH